MNPSDIVHTEDSIALVTNAYDITYLTGFRFSDPHTREAILLISSHEFHLIIPVMFANQIENLRHQTIYTLDNQRQGIWNLAIEQLNQNTYSQLIYQPEDLTAAEYHKLTGQLHASLRTTADLIQTHRSVKTKQEIDTITQATHITESIIPELNQILKTNITERQLSWHIKQLLHHNHAHDIAFEPVVAFGTHTANPHHIATDQPLTNNQLILIDWGASFNGYHSDITRMWHSGTPDDAIAQHYTQLQQIHQQIVADFSPGTPTKQLHQTADKLLTEFNLPTMIHSLGHGVGLQIHESPKLHAQSAETIQAYQPVTLEPAFYLPNQYGMRIEDLVYHDGRSLIRLTTSDNSLQVIQ